MAKIRLRFGASEVEIDSRDFYIDNDTAAQVIADLALRLQENSAKIITEDSALQTPDIAETYQANLDYLKMLRDAEVHEPEFSPASPITPDELPSKIEDLENDGFFSKPRTVSETVEQLLQHGWIASPLAVSKILVKMAFHKELSKSSEERKIFYYKETPLLN
ncbi:MAG: hypothetical protein ACT4OD_00625 [Candidatus Nitrosotenuis sp.]